MPSASLLVYIHQNTMNATPSLLGALILFYIGSENKDRQPEIWTLNLIVQHS